MGILALSRIDTSVRELVGGKAAGLGEMLRLGERVPGGFCLTTEAYASGAIPAEALAEAYQELGDGPVAVRSSATAEDQPDASFAGQQDTVLQVRGAEELFAAVRRCWDSLNNERAIAYRDANGIDHDTARMAVVVQRMVEPRAAGVLFTANPVTHSRSEVVIDAASGGGGAVVAGSVEPDHYVLDASPPAHEENGARARRLSEPR